MRVTADEAKNLYCGFRQRHGGEPNGRPELQPDGSCRFIEKEEGPPPHGVYNGVVVRPDGRAYEFHGALGKVFRTSTVLGLPKSNERLMSGTEKSRYQAFENGVAVWDAGTGIGFPLVESWSSLRKQLGIIAFFDLRGFTTWSEKADPAEVQAVVTMLEEKVQLGFPVPAENFSRQFFKGVGDGVMVVSQADWYKEDGSTDERMAFTQGHCEAFLSRCNATLANIRQELRPYSIAVGCGISAGALTRVFLFGRLDFIGPPINTASKLQQHAWNEVCITEDFRRHVEKDGVQLHGALHLPGKGWRLATPSEKPQGWFTRLLTYLRNAIG
jgi:class 3 adenylate cyclase